MTDKDPFVEALAEFRGTGYEAAAAQHEKDLDHLRVLRTEALITGEEDALYAEITRKDLMFELGQGEGTIFAKYGRLLPVPRRTTLEEDDRFLIEDTERKCVGDNVPMQVLLPDVRTAR